MSRTALLICEGQCNGGRVQSFDKAVDAIESFVIEDVHSADRIHAMQIRTKVLGDNEHALLKSLRYTLHVQTGKRDYSCNDCGTVRRW